MKIFFAALTLSCAALHAAGEPNFRPPPFEKSKEPILATEPIAPSNIQVLLEKDAAGVLLEVKGPYYIFNPHDGSRIASGILGKRFMIHELESGLKWGEEFAGIHQIYIKPRSIETTIFINGIQYGGAIAVFGVAGTINIVNDIDIEEYIKSILSLQFPSPLEPETLAALAIAARTDAYYQAMKSKDSFWHIIASDVDYQGAAMVVPNSPIERIVSASKGLILVHPVGPKNLPFAAHWTEHCAGKTAAYHSLFRKNGNTAEQGVEAPHAMIARQDSKWHYAISKKTLAHLLDVPEIKSMELFVDGTSNKVYGLRVKDGISSHDFDFFAIQKIVGSNHLLSSDFTVAIKDDTINFHGFGKGHGVGLCIYSANALAQNGENAPKILSKFFPDTYLYNLDAMQTLQAQ
jgi:stage II sporulation protein D